MAGLWSLLWRVACSPGFLSFSGLVVHSLSSGWNVFLRFFQEGRESPFSHLFSSGLRCGNNFSPSVSTLSVFPNQISCLFSASPLFHPLAFSACIKRLVKCFSHTTLSVCFSLSLLVFTASSEEFLFCCRLGFLTVLTPQVPRLCLASQSPRSLRRCFLEAMLLCLTEKAKQFSEFVFCFLPFIISRGCFSSEF